MKIWLTKNSEISVHDQLAEQITLGIASNDIKPGERLPSTRELARRLQIHQNTVSSVYRRLAKGGFVEFRKGSGVYVAGAESHGDGAATIDGLIRELISKAADAGLSPREFRDRVSELTDARKPERIVVIEENEDLREIIIEEIGSALTCIVEGTSPWELKTDDLTRNIQFAAMFDERAKLQSLLPLSLECTYLTANSVPSSMEGRTRPPRNEIVAVVSGWDTFLSLAKLYLIAAKVDPDSIVTRSRRERGWKKCIEKAGMTICDAASAKYFDSRHANVFRLVSDSSIEELKLVMNAEV